MAVYWAIFIWTSLVGLQWRRKENQMLDKQSGRFIVTRSFALWTFALVIFFAIFRTQCIDTAGYIASFNKAPTEFSQFFSYIEGRKAPLFNGCMLIFKYFVNSSLLWIGLIAVIEGVLTAKFLRKYSEDFGMSAYIFIASTLFTWMYNGIRQYLVVVILLNCTHWLLQRKWNCYLPMVMILAGIEPILNKLGLGDAVWFLGGIHQSALMMIPAYFLATGKAFNWKVAILILMSLAIGLLGGFNSAIEMAASDTEYAVSTLQHIVEDSGSSPFRALVAFVPVVLAFMCSPEQKRNFPPLIDLCVNMSTVAAVLYSISSVTSGIFIGRLPIYCEMYSLILLPWLFEHPYKDSKAFYKMALYTGYFLYFIYQMYFAWGGLTYVSQPLGIYLWGGVQ